MKKHLFLGIVGLCMSAISAYANDVETLIPQECSIENKLVYEPINQVHLEFTAHVDIAKDAKATITCGDKTMATGVITSDTYMEKGIALVSFEKLVLPKGKSYKLEIPAGAIFLKSAPDVKNGDLKFDFEVPEKIISTDCSVKNVSSVETEEHIWFYYGTETEPVGSPTMTLYREGVPVRTFDAHVGWDWNLGQAYADFGMKMNFEKGVHYSLVMPEGSLSPRFRTDITNEETRVDFIGGYTKPIEPITYVWCSLFDNHGIDVLGEVRFYYRQAVMLSSGPKIQLFDTDNNLIKVVTPTLSEDEDGRWGRWIVSCDFGGLRVPEKGCSIVIPEGTVISADGNVSVNAKNSFDVNIGTAGLGGVSNGKMEIKASDRRITIKDAPIGATVCVYSTDGKKVADHIVTSRNFVLNLTSNGIYVVSIDGKSYKVVI